MEAPVAQVSEAFPVCMSTCNHALRHRVRNSLTSDISIASMSTQKTAWLMLRYLQKHSEVDIKHKVNGVIYRRPRLFSIDSLSCWEADPCIPPIENTRGISKSTVYLLN